MSTKGKTERDDQGIVVAFSYPQRKKTSNVKKLLLKKDTKKMVNKPSEKRPGTTTIRSRNNVIAHSNNDTYEDDFESYSSDFEEDSDDPPDKAETINEHKLDSGTYDLETDQKPLDILDQIFENGNAVDEGFDSIKAKKKNSTRSQDLLRMIHLDYYTVTLLDLVPQDYWDINQFQTGTQTNRDNFDKITQTNLIETSTKCTQYPVTYPLPQNVQNQTTARLTENLKRFLRNAEALIDFTQIQQVQFNGRSAHIPKFATTSFKITTNQILARTFFVRILNTTKIITICIEANHKSGLYLWNIDTSKTPEKTIIIYGQINCCATTNWGFIFVGLNDGTITILNLNTDQPQTEFLPEIGKGHTSKIIDMKTVETRSNEYKLTVTTSNQLISLDEASTVIIWRILLGTAPALSRLKRININTLSLISIAIGSNEDQYFYLISKAGVFVPCLMNGTSTRYYVKASKTEYKYEINSVELCPFSPNFIIFGCNNGLIVLHSTLFQKPIRILTAPCTNRIKLIKWYNQQPFKLISVDSNDTALIWNLKHSDMVPESEFKLDKEVISINLSSDDRYLMLATRPGDIYLYNQTECDTCNTDVNHFINYTNKYL